MPFYCLFRVRPWGKDPKDITDLMIEKARKIPTTTTLPGVAATKQPLKTLPRNSLRSGWRIETRSSLPAPLVHLGQARTKKLFGQQPETSETQVSEGTDPDVDLVCVPHHQYAVGSRRRVVPLQRRSLDYTTTTTQDDDEEEEPSLEFSPFLPRSSLKVKTLPESLASPSSSSIPPPPPPPPQRHVHWGRVEFREYSICLGDNPACSDGAPIQLSWSYKRYKAITVWEFERIRGPPRLQRHSSTVRQVWLLHEGYTLYEILAATDQKEHDQRLRKQTVSRIHFMALDQRVEQLWKLVSTRPRRTRR